MIHLRHKTYQKISLILHLMKKKFTHKNLLINIDINEIRIITFFDRNLNVLLVVIMENNKCDT